MILVLKKDTRQEEMDNLITWLESQNVRTHISRRRVLRLLLASWAILRRSNIDLISGLDIVENVHAHIQEPYKNANRKFHPDDTRDHGGGGTQIGGGDFQFIAGPCSVESRGADLSAWPRRVRGRAHSCCAAARSSPAPPPTPSRACSAEGIELLLEAKTADRPAHRHRDHEHLPPAAVRGRGRHPGRRAQHAELRAAQGAGQRRQAHPAQSAALPTPSRSF